MREIKFRAWDKKKKVFEYAWFEECAYEFLHEKRFIIEQFTGLKDKNGKEIYEGDILTGEPYNQEVIFDEEKCGFRVLEYLKDFTRNSKLNQRDIDYNKRKIIGNKLDNPKLLEC